jgi:hypothetical protein
MTQYPTLGGPPGGCVFFVGAIRSGLSFLRGTASAGPMILRNIPWATQAMQSQIYCECAVMLRSKANDVSPNRWRSPQARG